MAGGGLPERTGINWPAAGIAFQLLMVIIAGLMAYAYLNGGTSTRVERLETDLRDKASKQDVAALRQYTEQRADDADRRLDRLERRR